MNDLERAKKLLKGAVTCAFVKGAQERTSVLTGIRPLMELLDGGETLEGYSAADKIVGRAAAFLYVRLGVAAVYAEVLSAKGEEILKKYGIPYEYREFTENIINRTGDGPCPMEAATEKISDPKEAEEVLRAKLASMRGGKSLRFL